MTDDLIVYKVRPNYFDESADDYLIFTWGVSLAEYLNYTTYPCTVSTVSRRTHECITTSS
jgi:hypothetical protein